MRNGGGPHMSRASPFRIRHSAFIIPHSAFLQRSHMRLNRIAVAAGVVVVLIAAGCQSGPAKPTPKEEATRKWNAARATVLAGLARDQFQAGNFDKARQTVDDALRMVPDNAPLHVLSAQLLIEKGQLEAAERELAAARQYAP